MWKITYFVKNQNIRKDTFLLFPVSTLQAVFHNDGTDNELSIASASTVPHKLNTESGRPAFLQHPVSVTAVVIFESAGVDSAWHWSSSRWIWRELACECLHVGVPLCETRACSSEPRWYCSQADHREDAAPTQPGAERAGTSAAFLGRGWWSAPLAFSVTNCINFTVKNWSDLTEAPNLSHRGRPFSAFLPKYL